MLEGGDGNTLLPPPSSSAASPLLFESSAPFACISSQREVHHSLIQKPSEWNQEVVPFDALDLVKSDKYQCPMCTMEFIDKNRFRHHYMVHSGERPYACPMCPYRARRNDTLRLHIVVKHGFKKWFFNKCSCIRYKGFKLDDVIMGPYVFVYKFDLPYLISKSRWKKI